MKSSTYIDNKLVIKQKNDKADLILVINNENLYIKKNILKKIDYTIKIYDIFLFKLNDYIKNPKEQLKIDGPKFNLKQSETLEINNNIITRNNIIDDPLSPYICFVFYQKKGEDDQNIDIGVGYYHPDISENYSPAMDKKGFEILNEAFLKIENNRDSLKILNKDGNILKTKGFILGDVVPDPNEVKTNKRYEKLTLLPMYRIICKIPEEQNEIPLVVSSMYKDTTSINPVFDMKKRESWKKEFVKLITLSWKPWSWEKKDYLPDQQEGCDKSKHKYSSDFEIRDITVNFDAEWYFGQIDSYYNMVKENNSVSKSLQSFKGLFETENDWKKEFIFWENDNFSSPKSFDRKCVFSHKKCPLPADKPPPPPETCAPCKEKKTDLEEANTDTLYDIFKYHSRRNYNMIIFKTIIIVSYIIMMSFFIKMIRNNLKIKLIDINYI